jgi:hypothetical protein
MRLLVSLERRPLRDAGGGLIVGNPPGQRSAYRDVIGQRDAPATARAYLVNPAARHGRFVSGARPQI